MNRLEGDMQLEQVRVCTKIAIECMALDPKKRPAARHIIGRLHKISTIDETSISIQSVQQKINLLKEQQSQDRIENIPDIPTKINKGTVEIITPVELIKKGDKVGSSESALLAKLAIRPFSYELVISNVYGGGSVFTPEVLDLTDEDLMDKFLNAYKNVLAIAVETDYSYPHADKIKEYLRDPSKFAVAAPATTAASVGGGAAAPEEEKKDEPAEESDEEMSFSLFDD